MRNIYEVLRLESAIHVRNRLVFRPQSHTISCICLLISVRILKVRTVTNSF